MVTNIHHAPAGRAITVEDIQFPESEIRILGPSVGHPASLRAAVRSIDGAARQKLTLGIDYLLALSRVVVFCEEGRYVRRTVTAFIRNILSNPSIKVYPQSDYSVELRNPEYLSPEYFELTIEPRCRPRLQRLDADADPRHAGPTAGRVHGGFHGRSSPLAQGTWLRGRGAVV